MNPHLIPISCSCGKNNAQATAGKPKVRDVLMETVVILFFSLGPVVGAVLFLMWFGGLAWGVLSSLFR